MQRGIYLLCMTTSPVVPPSHYNFIPESTIIALLLLLLRRCHMVFSCHFLFTDKEEFAKRQGNRDGEGCVTMFSGRVYVSQTIDTHTQGVVEFDEGS